MYRVEARNRPIELTQLGVRCDEREIPYPLEGDASDFFLGLAQVTNSGPLLEQSGEPADAPETITGFFAACVFESKMTVVVGPESERIPSYWFVLDLARAKVYSGAQIGLFKKRPGSILVETDNLAVDFIEPARYFSNGRAQAKQAVSMLETLQGLASSDPRPSSTDSARSVPGDAIGINAAGPAQTSPESAPQPIDEGINPAQPSAVQPPPPKPGSAIRPPAQAISSQSDGLFYAMWIVAGVVGLVGFGLGMAAGAALYLLALVFVGVAWWPFVKIGGFFFGIIELLEVPPIAVAVLPWMALVVAAVLSVP